VFLNGYRLRVVQEVLTDWRQRSISKPRNVLPLHFSRTLQHIRRLACKAEGITDCDCYKDGDFDFEPGTNPCADCKAPAISLNEFSLVVWGTKTNEGTIEARQKKGDLMVDVADLRGWINGRAPIQPADMQRVVAVAWKNQWINSSNATTIANRIADAEATSSVLRRFLKRLRERVSFRKDRIIKDHPEQLEDEIEQELLKMKREEDTWLTSQRNVPEAVKSLLRNDQVSQIALLDCLRDNFTTNSPQRRI